ncbi:MAG: ribosome recycling factor, partial [Deltaproteobacteria bacterium]|nr:ribosome recycling factor [Deltaproteobacteria bacterium]
KRELTGGRTGRANLAILDGIRVEYYGTLTPLNQVAALAVADPRLITIRPWERNMISVIERAIIQEGLGINPSNDGELIRLPIPPLSGERRRELIKMVKNHGEQARVALRNQRRDAIETLKDYTKEGEVTEDEQSRALKRIEDLMKDWTGRVNDLIEKKEKEISEV